MLAATIEMNAFKNSYQAQVISNARALAKACASEGIPVEGGEDEGYTRTHQVIIRVNRFGDAKEIASRLEASNIITNYQALPCDETFYHPSGIRMGVQEMTRFGMKESDFDALAPLLADVILRKKDVSREVAEFRGRFNRMEYSLTLEQTLRIVPRLLESIFPREDCLVRLSCAPGRI
jgi:glycine/serine hydroxymethyltransferase